MTDYVCGFAFNEDATLVALIGKLRPEWQAGLLNGIGGHVERQEIPNVAMQREFFEEAGLGFSDWENFLVLMDANARWRVYFYRAFGVPLGKVESMTDERVGVYPVVDGPLSVVPNLRWLIPLAADRNWATTRPLKLYDTSGVD